MSEIPPNIAASGAQAGFQQAEIAKARDAQRTGQSAAARRGVKSIDDAGATIETGDEDVAVFSDAEGAGGQGRFSEEESAEDQVEETPRYDTDPSPNPEDDAPPHIDIQA